MESIKRKSEGIIPANIFDFLYKLFRLLFSDTPAKQDIAKFLRCVYWTHIAKRSLKCLGGSKIKYAKMCSASIIKELKEIRPKLIVIASSVALHILFNRGYKESFEKQVEKVREFGKLLTVEELIFEKGEPLLSRISVLKNCEIAVFPNPSPAAGKWKKEAYGKIEITNVLRYINQYCKTAC
ncbi:MAG: hypothetical protein ACPLF9_08765 [Methanothermobacter tenebrarum]